MQHSNSIQQSLRALTLACTMALPVTALAAEPTYSDFAVATGITSIIHPGPLGAGAAIIDFDDDGDLDVFVANGNGHTSELFRNEGNLVFSKVADAMGLSDDGPSLCGAFGDFDGDRDLDLFLSNFEGVDRLYRNDGVSFEDISIQAGISSASQSSAGASWADYDRDGDLDLMVAVYSLFDPNHLYRNDGGTFVDVAPAMGITAKKLSFQPVFFDCDGDDDLDLFVSNDKSDLNHLFRNDGAGAPFVDVATAAAVQGPIDAMGVAVGDFDASGSLDFYVTNTPGGNPFFLNNGVGVFQDVASDYGVTVNRTGWGTLLLDYDLDADLDLYVVNTAGIPAPFGANKMFRNDGAGTPMEDVSVDTVLDDQNPGWGVAQGDLDGDGYLEMILVNQGQPIRVFKTGGVGSPHWLQMQLVGVSSNTRGIGARIQIEHNGSVQQRQIRAGESYLSQCPARAAFGLGTDAVVDRVLVQWPSGVVDELSNVSADQLLVVTEGSFPVASPPARAAGSVAIRGAYPNPFNPSLRIRVEVERTQALTVAVFDLAGRRIQTLSQGLAQAGSHELSWDGRDGSGHTMPSGVYLIRAEGETALSTLRVTLVQ